MGLFGNQFANVIEWEEYNDDMLFWKWSNKEIKKGSRLIIKPGQDAIFLYNGKVEGVFVDDGRYDIESQIIPFLSTLKGFKFGFNSGIRAEVLFINTKEVTVNLYKETKQEDMKSGEDIMKNNTDAGSMSSNASEKIMNMNKFDNMTMNTHMSKDMMKKGMLPKTSAAPEGTMSSTNSSNSGIIGLIIASFLGLLGFRRKNN